MELKDKLEEVAVQEVHLIDASWYVEKNAKSFRLVNNNDETFRYTFKNKEYKFEFQRPIYVKHMTIEWADSVPEVKFTANDLVSQGALHLSARIDGHRPKVSIVEPNAIIVGFTLKALSGFFSGRPVATALSVYGLSLDETVIAHADLTKLAELRDAAAAEVARIYREISARESDVKQREQELAEAEEESEQKLLDANEALEKVEEEKIAAEKELAEIRASVNRKEAELQEKKKLAESASSEAESARRQNEKLKASVDLLRKEEVEKNGELQRLTRSLGLYSNEYGSFFKQGNRFILLYAALSLVPAGVMATTMMALLLGAADLTTLYTRLPPNVSIADVILTRIPYVTISYLLLQFSYLAIKLLGRQIIDIQREKMNFSKISIVAQDVVEQSSEDLEISHEEKFRENIKLRMELLREYLKESLDYEKEIRRRNNSILENIGHAIPTGVIGRIVQKEPPV